MEEVDCNKRFLRKFVDYPKAEKNRIMKKSIYLLTFFILLLNDLRAQEKISSSDLNGQKAPKSDGNLLLDQTKLNDTVWQWDTR